MFGEIAFFAPHGRRTLTARCAEDCAVLSLHQDTLRQIYYQNPSFGFELIGLVAGRLSADVERLEEQLAKARRRRAEPPAPPSRADGPPARYSCGRKSIDIDGGTRPSTSRGRISVLSIARSTVSSQAGEPLLLVSLRLTIVPSGASRTSTVASGLPATLPVRTMFGLIRALIRPA